MNNQPKVFGLLFVASIFLLGIVSYFQGGLVPPVKASSVQVIYFGTSG